jgi:hypothetical protein
LGEVAAACCIVGGAVVVGKELIVLPPILFGLCLHRFSAINKPIPKKTKKTKAPAPANKGSTIGNDKSLKKFDNEDFNEKSY